MYKCNSCGTIFDSPAEQQREVEYYPRPFGNGSEPYGGGYYECCPECDSEDFDRYDEEDYIDDLKHQLALTEKALELACDKIGDMFGSNYQNAWFFGSDGNSIIMREEFEEYFKTKAKEILDET